MKKFEINFSENVDFNANTNKSNNANINEADKFIYKCIYLYISLVFYNFYISL